MINWFTKLVFGSLTIGTPSLVAFGGFIDWREGVAERTKGLDNWLAKAWEKGGGENVNENVAKLKEEIIQSSKWEHPGLFVETVGEYMKRILNKDGSFGSGSERTKFEVNGVKKVFEKVGFQYDRSSGGLRLSLETKKEGQEKNKFLTQDKDLCILSIARTNNGKIGKLDLLVGFYKGEWTGNTITKSEKNENMISGYGDWCARRAVRFEKERNLIIGIPFKSKHVQAEVSANKANKITYKVEDKAIGFIGKDLGMGKGYDRICGTKANENNCKEKVWPIVFGVIGNKIAGDSKFEGSSPVEEFSEIYFGSKTWNTKNQVTCTGNEGKTCNIGIPVGVRFNNVKITGKSLSDWSTNP